MSAKVVDLFNFSVINTELKSLSTLGFTVCTYYSESVHNYRVSRCVGGGPGERWFE